MQDVQRCSSAAKRVMSLPGLVAELTAVRLNDLAAPPEPLHEHKNIYKLKTWEVRQSEVK